MAKQPNNREIIKKRNANFKAGELVRVTKYGDFTEIMSANFKPRKGKVNIRRENGKLVNSKNHEVINVKHANNRSESLTSIKRSLKKLNQLISCNFTGAEDELFLTLTYQAPFQLDPYAAKKDWKRLYQNFRNNYPGSKYIAIFEPQGRLYPNEDQKMVPNWHIHVLIKGITEDISAKLTKWWQPRGSFKIQHISEFKTNNLGAYFTRYVKNLSLTFVDDVARKVLDENDVSILQSDNKSVAKGARLLFYPPRFRIYVASQGLKEPVISYIPFDQLDVSEFGEKTLTSTVKVKDTKTSKILNTYKYVNYRNK